MSAHAHTRRGNNVYRWLGLKSDEDAFGRALALVGFGGGQSRES